MKIDRAKLLAKKYPESAHLEFDQPCALLSSIQVRSHAWRL